MTRVRITTGPHEIEIEAAGAKAATLAELALSVWRDTRDDRLHRLVAPVGFAQTELATPLGDEAGRYCSTAPLEVDR
jgi:hypothetical protein